MKRKLAALVVWGVFVAGCGESNVKPLPQTVDGRPHVLPTSDADTNNQFSLDDFVVGVPVRFKNLTIFPVASRESKTDDRFITLDEGLKAGTIEIREVAAQIMPIPNQGPANASPTSIQAVSATDEVDLSDDGFGNDVNSLIVVNHSDKPLYLMPGEVIIGGSQDRTIGEELVIAPDNEPKRVPVFCVEHGRWGAKGTEQTLEQLDNAGSLPAVSVTLSLNISQTQSRDQLAQDADKGKFVASIGQLGKSARVAVQSDKDQSAVWDKVAETNAKSGVETASGAFTANYCDADTVKRLEPYLESLQLPIATHDQIVGVLVAINGKIESIDVFESTPLFQKIWPKLLKSYSLDAVNAEDDSSQKSKECTREAALAFFAETLHANVASSDTEHGIGLVKRDGKHVLSFTSHIESDAAPAAMGGGMGGMGGGGVHFSGFAK